MLKRSRRPSPAMVLASLSLFVALSGVGVAATNGNFILGNSNTANQQTALTGSISGNPQLRVENAATGNASFGIVGKITSSGAAANTAGVKGSTAATNSAAAAVLGTNLGGGPGLAAVVNPGSPPLSVNSSTKVDNLNADKLDGLDSTELSGLTDYGYVYNTGAQTVALEAAVVFDTNGVTTPGISHTAGTSQITVNAPGDYRISFSVTGVGPNQFALFQNGFPVAGVVYGSGAGTQQNNGQAIIALAFADVLTLRNHSSAAAVTLQTLAGGTQTNVNASVVIEKLA